MKDINTYFTSISISGVDAKRFLQGQLTCNLDEVTENEFRFGAHCNPKGRIIHFFRLFTNNEKYYLSLPKEMISIAIQALKKYAMFFKVEIKEENNDSLSQNFSLSEDIQKGIPQVYATTSGKFLPHELNLQFINAISFNKGCFTGQEIIARMHYRGQPKTLMHRAFCKTNILPLAGAEIFCDNQIAGDIVSACHVENGIECLFVANKNDVANKTFYLSESSMPLEILPLPYNLS